VGHGTQGVYGHGRVILVWFDFSDDETRMTLYSYILTHDTGFAPNPFFDCCTLACCKPNIRRRARPGDWIVGLTPRARGNKVVYFMQVQEVLDFGRYWNDKRFRQKRPRFDRDVRSTRGDNIYEPMTSGAFRQLRSRHSHGERENIANKKRDLSGLNVLVSKRFAYYGSKALPLPPELRCLTVGRGHRCRFSEGEKRTFLQFARNKAGIHGPPCRWTKDGDTSWRAAGCGVR
jgi:hypothetical protein